MGDRYKRHTCEYVKQYFGNLQAHCIAANHCNLDYQHKSGQFRVLKQWRYLKLASEKAKCSQCQQPSEEEPSVWRRPIQL
jgi:hypothetical protein